LRFDKVSTQRDLVRLRLRNKHTGRLYTSALTSIISRKI
jgi:hypothetical protein